MTEASLEPNPYAAPLAELQLPQQPSGAAAFYPMSPKKAALMSIGTMGLYDLVFWYRHWARLQQAGHDVSPLPRTVFAAFTSFGFVNTLHSARGARSLSTNARLRATPWIYLTTSVFSLVSGQLGEKLYHPLVGLLLTLLVCIVDGWVLATVQRGANEVLAADDYRGPTNSEPGTGAIVAALIGLAVWGFTVMVAVYPEAFSGIQ